MTIDEAKDYIREWCPYDRQEEIIKALKQQPCDDAISRQAVMEHYSTGEIAHCHHISRNNLLDFVEQLPPVTPQEPKTGHWIDDKCSVCGEGTEDFISSREWYMNKEPNFCPNCGIKIEEVEE